MRVAIPEFCLVAVVASSRAEGLAFARRHFTPREVVDRSAPDWPAVAAGRLARRELVAVVLSEAAVQTHIDIIRLAKRFYAQPIAIVICGAGDGLDASTGRGLESTGLRPAHLVGLTEREAVEIERERLPPDKRGEHGPFDIIGDVHGCADELKELLGRLGYRVRFEGGGDERRVAVEPPAGRRAIFVGDFADRGPRSTDVLRIAMAMTMHGHAMAVPGNHDVKLVKWLRGANVRLTHGLDLTAAQFAHEGTAFRKAVRDFLLGLPSHLWLEDGRLAVAHAGILEEMIGRDSPGVHQFCLYGDTEGETDATGLVVRYHWAAAYRGRTAIVYGHTPVPDAEWVNNTLCIDTGCCFGGKLTALRWPEREVLSVAARRMYAVPGRPFAHPPVRPAGRRPARRQRQPGRSSP